MSQAHDHWQGVFTTKTDAEVSWYQPRPDVSLDLMTAAAPDRDAAIIDVGGGTSTLTDHLLAAGYHDLTVLDISEAALARARQRLGAEADKVAWIAADITRWAPDRRWDIWHDRAAFHFLTDTAGQDAYIRAMTEATAPQAVVIIATFALDGPERCSGLPVQRYSPTTLAARLGPEFVLLEGRTEDHVTPAGAVQRFSYAVFRRGAANDAAERQHS
jgi:SAM-dependent methyltransferase